MNDRLNKFFMRIPKRSESEDRATLVQTFVDLDPLVTLISVKDHQIVYGRRGTGKTHALLYKAEAFAQIGDIAVYVDMRTIGSAGGLYGDPAVPIPERGTRLLVDTLEAVHESLLSQILERDNEFDISVLGPRLDFLVEAITQVRVTGSIEIEESTAREKSSQQTASSGVTLSEKGLSVDLKSADTAAGAVKSGVKSLQKGTLQHRVHFGNLSSALRDVAEAIRPRRLWLILDEWSAVPTVLQPLLADLIRRCVLPVQGVTVKIGAIEHRSSFQEGGVDGDYLGIELGADVSADVNLDDFMVFDNSAEKAKTFFAQLLYKHAIAIANEDGDSLQFSSADELVAHAFTRRDVFEEYVRASEGVPRDAINIISLAARQADKASITMENVRTAAKLWYERDKQPSVNANPAASDLLFTIVDEVIGHRRTRAFLWRSGMRDPLIDELFDKRVIHILKRNVSTKDEPGARYDVFKIDYGCYVDLLTTAKTPKGLLFNEENQTYVDVPPDDYRAIRRAVLTLEDINKKRLPLNSDVEAS